MENNFTIYIINIPELIRINNRKQKGLLYLKPEECVLFHVKLNNFSKIIN